MMNFIVGRSEICAEGAIEGCDIAVDSLERNTPHLFSSFEYQQEGRRTTCCVVERAKFGPFRSERLAHQSFNPVPLDWIEGLAWCNKCNLDDRRGFLCAEVIPPDELSIESSAFPIESLKPPAASNRIPRSHLSFITDCKFMTSFCASARQNFAAVFGSHASTESVRIPPLSLVRLKCSFHRSVTPSTELSNLAQAKKW
jgi:hypothetical protein